MHPARLVQSCNPLKETVRAMELCLSGPSLTLEELGAGRSAYWHALHCFSPLYFAKIQNGFENE
jgi:hypothetical protein